MASQDWTLHKPACFFVSFSMLLRYFPMVLAWSHAHSRGCFDSVQKKCDKQVWDGTIYPTSDMSKC